MASFRLRPRFNSTKNRKKYIACNNEKMMKERRVSDGDSTSNDFTDCESESSISMDESIPRSQDQEVSYHSQNSISVSLSSRRENECHQNRVRFIDEAMGLTPRHIVTEVRYRPKTTPKELSRFYYTSREYSIFEQEDLVEQLESEITELQKCRHDKSLSREVSNDGCDEDKRREDLVTRISIQYNLRIAL